MPDRHSFGEIHLDVTAGRERLDTKPSDTTPFRIAILGDFSGRASRGLMETGDALANQRMELIDRDNFDAVFARLSPQLEFRLGGSNGIPVSLKFTDLDDFHPDNLYRNVALFQKLRDTREKLGDAKSFAQTAGELGIRTTPPAVNTTATPATPATSSDAVEQALSGNFLDQLVEETEKKSEQSHPSRVTDPWTAVLRSIVAPHVVPKPDPRQADALGLIDLANSAQMSRLLHLPQFQALESAWRAVYFLVRNLETSSRLEVVLIDVTKNELARDLASAPDITSTGTYRLLVENSVGTPGAKPWALLAGIYTCDSSPDDTEFLARMAKVAAAAGAPFLAAAAPLVLGCGSIDNLPDPRRWVKSSSDDASSWQALRSSAEARYLGLVLPRFLIRLPYGKETETTEAFDFDEIPDSAAHEDYLWANPAFAAVLLLAQTFTRDGWAMRPGTLSDITGVPMHIYSVEGEPISKPCAEVLMTQTAAEAMLDAGIMPLASLKDQSAVRLVRFQSVANPPTAPAGRWSLER